ncbi:TPR-like protein [Cadophora sp. DSE1049]|nr:TPR-like protein [Cadophora sp. DSE1049]
MAPPIKTAAEYSLAVICPLEVEALAMIEQLDEEYDEEFSKDCLFTLGRIGEHNIVLTSLPAGRQGHTSAAVAAQQTMAKFLNITSVLLVGIAGGVPSEKNDIRLGDVVVSFPRGKYGGVVQYDFGKDEEQFKYSGQTNSVPQKLLAYLSSIRLRHDRKRNAKPKYLEYLEARMADGLEKPSGDSDRLFLASYIHQGGPDCTTCDEKQAHRREPRESRRTHYGLIASGNRVMKNAERRDGYNKDHGGIILAHEMEAAGLMNFTPCLVIRGISDYADSHKPPGKGWHSYAAAVAAAYAREFIEKVPVEAVSGMQTTVKQTAAYINENGITLSEYLSLLDDKEENVIEVLSEDFEDEGDIGMNSAVTSAAGAIEEKDGRCDWNLKCLLVITKRPADQFFDLHRLVHLATRNWLREEGLLEEWIAKAVARLADVFPNDDHENRTIWRAYLPHARYALTSDLVHESVGANLSLLERFGQCLLSDGRYNEAEDPFVEVVERRKRVLGPEHPDTLSSTANLASTYSNQGRWKEAEELEVQIMETFIRELGRQHPSTLTSMGNLGSTYRRQGRWKEAEDLEVQVVETRKRVLGQEHLDTLSSMANLASTYWNQGRWNNAEELEAQVMETSKRVLGQENPDTLTSIANLASTFWNQGRWKDAEELFVQVIETRKIVLGQEHPDTLISMANLASAFWNQGQWKQAEELEVKVMETFKRVLGQMHPDTLTSMANLASTFWNQGRLKEAEELFVQVIETRKRVLGHDHPDTLTSKGGLALTYKDKGQREEAEELEVKVMETRTKVLGWEHPHTLISMVNLASTYKNQGRWKQAEDLEVQMMETFKRVLGQEHPDTLTCMANLAFTWKSQDHSKEA